jgi:hypothetical protein
MALVERALVAQIAIAHKAVVVVAAAQMVLAKHAASALAALTAAVADTGQPRRESALCVLFGQVTHAHSHLLAQGVLNESVH